MRMPKEHVEMLEGAFAKLNALDPLSERRSRYEAEGLSPKRFHWDCYWDARALGHVPQNWVCEVVYPLGMNDSHVDTALRKALSRY